MCGCHYHTNRHARCTCVCDHRGDAWLSERKTEPQPEPDIIIDPVRRAAKLSGLILELVDCFNSLDDHISDKELADKLRELADEFDPQPIVEKSYIDILFDGPPADESGRFVEAEDSTGASINAGEWLQRNDGYWALRIEK